MNFPIRELARDEFPPLLHEIPDPPKTLNHRGALPPPDLKLLAVVGSRNYTTYGKQVVEHLISGLRGYPIGIISGLALGIDSLAHKAALAAGLYTLAVPGGGLDDSVIYPRTHHALARQILEAGGGLLSEYDPHFEAAPWSFPKRNRIVTGMSHATLLIEAGEKSGTLISARLAADYNREVLVVPGNIFSQNSVGCHQFLKLGATPVTEPADILHALGIEPREQAAAAPSSCSPEERQVLDALREPTDRDALLRSLSMESSHAAMLVMELELKGLIAEENGILRRR